MEKIPLLPHKDITPVLDDDLRNKFAPISLVLDQLDKAQQPTDYFVRITMESLDYIEKKLVKFELKNKLPRIRTVLETFSQAKQLSQESVKLALEDYEYIKNVLDSLSPPVNPPNLQS